MLINVVITLILIMCKGCSIDHKRNPNIIYYNNCLHLCILLRLVNFSGHVIINSFVIMTNIISTSITLRRIYNDSSNCDNKIRHCSSALILNIKCIPVLV